MSILRSVVGLQGCGDGQPLERGRRAALSSSGAHRPLPSPLGEVFVGGSRRPRQPGLDAGGETQQTGLPVRGPCGPGGWPAIEPGRLVDTSNWANMATLPDLRSDVGAVAPGITALRRALHQHPELAFNEVWTAGT